MIDKPGDRAATTAKLAEAVGGTMECFYWMLGPHDGVAIVNVPDAAAAAGVSMGIAAGGALKSLESHRLLTKDEAMAALRGGQGRQGRVSAPRHVATSRARPERLRQRIGIGGVPAGGQVRLVLIHSVPGRSTPRRSSKTNATLV